MKTEVLSATADQTKVRVVLRLAHPCGLGGLIGALNQQDDHPYFRPDSA